MSGKIYWHLLLFCGVLCQVICVKLSDEDNSLSSDSLVRKRRVINLLPNGRVSIPIESVSYMVRVKQGRRIVCAGAILSHYTVITATPCFRDHYTTYQIYSGASGDTGVNLVRHNITTKLDHYGNSPHISYDGITLVTVDPPFQFNSKTGYIELYVGPLRTGAHATVFGWGYWHSTLQGTELRHRLRHIMLPIMDLAECRNEYLHQFPISPKNLCTYCEHQYCAQNDEGAPLVVDDRLAGIHVYKGTYHNQKNPDVYVNLQHPDYRQWLRENTLLM